MLIYRSQNKLTGTREPFQLSDIYDAAISKAVIGDCKIDS